MNDLIGFHPQAGQDRMSAREEAEEIEHWTVTLFRPSMKIILYYSFCSLAFLLNSCSKKIGPDLAYVFYVEPLMNLSSDPVASVLYLYPDNGIGTFEMSLEDFNGGKNLWLAHLSSKDGKEIYILSLKVSGSGDCHIEFDLKKEVQLKFVSKGEQFHVANLALDSNKNFYYLGSGKGELDFSFQKGPSQNIAE